VHTAIPGGTSRATARRSPSGAGAGGEQGVRNSIIMSRAPRGAAFDRPQRVASISFRQPSEGFSGAAKGLPRTSNPFIKFQFISRNPAFSMGYARRQGKNSLCSSLPLPPRGTAAPSLQTCHRFRLSATNCCGRNSRIIDLAQLKWRLDFRAESGLIEPYKIRSGAAWLQAKPSLIRIGPKPAPGYDRLDRLRGAARPFTAASRNPTS
jgi:hypothetical protein